MNNHQLIARMKDLLRREASLMIEVLEGLNEMHRRKLWLSQGYPTFHEYCVAVLGMSEDSAARRLHVAALLQRYPRIVRPLILERRVHMSGLSLLYPLITDDNAERLLNEAAGKSRRQIEEIRSRERPKPDISSGIRRQPAVTCVLPTQALLAGTTPALQLAIVDGSKLQHIEVRSPDRHAFRTMMSTKTREALERVCAMTGQSHEEIFAKMVDTYETELLRKRYAQTKGESQKAHRPTTRGQPVAPTSISTDTAFAAARAPRKGSSRYIPAPVRRAVWKRDKGRCTFEGECGPCNSTSEIQYHHINNYADGGKPTVENITLHCRAHNSYQAELDFGPAFVAAAIARKRRRRRLRTGAESGKPRAAVKGARRGFSKAQRKGKRRAG